MNEADRENGVAPVADRQATISFLLTEYESLRAEQLQKIAGTSSLVRFALVSHGAIWAWLATNQDTIPAIEVAAWAPVALAVLFAGFYWALRKDIRVIGEKLATLESHFAVDPSLGWETDKDVTYTRIVALHYGLWLLLAATNVVVAFAVT